MPETPGRAPEREIEPRKEQERPRYEMYAARARSFEREKADQRCEDNGFIDPEHGSAGAFDGLGGTSSGEIASGMASLFCEKELGAIIATDPKIVQKELRDILQGAHEKIWTQAQRIHSNMMTTGLIVKLFQHEGVNYAAYAWVGDTRAHRITADSQADILTLDDALWLAYVPKEQQRLEQYHQALATHEKELQEFVDQKLTLSESFSMDNRITQTLGKSKVDKHGRAVSPAEVGVINIHSGVTVLDPGDRLLLTTDGIHGPIPLDKLAEIASDNPEAAPQKLIDEAHEIAKQGLPRSHNDDCLAILISPKK
jgi:serine/threonine protein phosphatase PrpC